MNRSMDIFVSWSVLIPNDPIEAYQKWRQENESHVQYYLNQSSYSWTPLQLVVSWGERDFTFPLLRNLLLDGADPNIYSSLGLNTLHYIILSLYYSKEQRFYERVLRYFLKKSKLDWYRICLHPSLEYFPFDLFLRGQMNDFCNMFWRYQVFPFITYSHRDSHHKLTSTRFQILTILFCCFGAPYTCQSRFLKKINTFTYQDILAYSAREPLLKDFVIGRLKLPFPIKNDLNDRVRFLSSERVKSSLERMIRRFDESSVDHFFHPELEHGHDFRDYETVKYKNTLYHKSTLSYFLKTNQDPFTREQLPRAFLEKWFDSWNEEPFHFYQSFLWRDTVRMFPFVFPKLEIDENYHLIQSRLLFLDEMVRMEFSYHQLYKMMSLNAWELDFIGEQLADVYLLKEMFMENKADLIGLQKEFLMKLNFYVFSNTTYASVIVFAIEEILKKMPLFSESSSYQKKKALWEKILNKKKKSFSEIEEGT